MLTLSLHRITFAPGTGQETLVLDWGELAETALPSWAQEVQVVAGLRSQVARVRARGNLSRQLVVRRRRVFATAAALLQAGWEQDAALDDLLGLTAGLKIELHDRPSAAGTLLLTATASECALRDMQPVPVPEELALDTIWTFDTGGITTTSP